VWLRKKSGRAFVLHTNTLACYAVRQGGADYTHPISRPDVVRRPDGSVELDASSLVVTAIRVAKAPDFALIPVEVLVDDRPQPTLLWSLASGLKKKHASLRVTPESAAPLIEEALSPLASRDPWAIEQPAAGLASHIVRQGTSEKTP
jgi:hypothetical protein